jgi:hypothetical protein
MQGKKFENDLYEQRGSLPMLKLRQTNDILYTVPIKEDEGEVKGPQAPAEESKNPTVEENPSDEPPAVPDDPPNESMPNEPNVSEIKSAGS